MCCRWRHTICRCAERLTAGQRQQHAHHRWTQAVCPERLTATGGRDTHHTPHLTLRLGSRACFASPGCLRIATARCLGSCMSARAASLALDKHGNLGPSANPPSSVALPSSERLASGGHRDSPRAHTHTHNPCKPDACGCSFCLGLPSVFAAAVLAFPSSLSFIVDSLSQLGSRLFVLFIYSLFSFLRMPRGLCLL